MDELNLELEALRAIYTEKEFSVENNGGFYSITIQITKERELEFNCLNYENITLTSGENIKFVRIRLVFLLDKDYPENSCPILNNVNVALFDGKYCDSNETTFEKYKNNSNNDIDFEHNNAGKIVINASTIVCLNSDQVYNYYDQIKNDYIGRVCLFDIIENILSFIYELSDDLIKQQLCLDFGSNLQNNEDIINKLNNSCEYGENNDDNISDNEPIFSGLTDRVLCSIEERVTSDEFNAWKEKFREEMIEKNIWKGEYRDLNVLTGKQLFERDASLLKSDENNSSIEIT
ncbi:hypothetical protein FG386_000910 [Cryptosporidium ryanae]|uniref:uncharacterized protein n=1 Tax=Cryptosporidium ryanae TaxID=515981 RepID=UPI003519E6C7|nr:hypothetical protein FG386_000910 [Cryptosporidium ryanae]